MTQEKLKPYPERATGAKKHLPLQLVNNFLKILLLIITQHMEFPIRNVWNVPRRSFQKWGQLQSMFWKIWSLLTETEAYRSPAHTEHQAHTRSWGPQHIPTWCSEPRGQCWEFCSVTPGSEGHSQRHTVLVAHLCAWAVDCTLNMVCITDKEQVWLI